MTRGRAARRRLIVTVLATAALAVVTGVQAGPAFRGGAITTPGPFALTRADGSKLDSLDLDGAPYALMFGFTHCPDICPTALAEVTAALAQAAGLRADYRVYFVAIDDARDTPQTVKTYLSAFDGRIVGLAAR